MTYEITTRILSNGMRVMVYRGCEIKANKDGRRWMAGILMRGGWGAAKGSSRNAAITNATRLIDSLYEQGELT